MSGQQPSALQRHWFARRYGGGKHSRGTGDHGLPADDEIAWSYHLEADTDFRGGPGVPKPGAGLPKLQGYASYHGAAICQGSRSPSPE